jgi:hypothetical protein
VAPARAAAASTVTAGVVTQRMIADAFAEAARATPGAERDRLTTVARELAQRAKR